jgi:2'-5' RNA ligase
MIRLFAALDLPPDIAAALTARQNGLRDARWRPLASLHITLRFFGDIAEDVASDLDEELGRLDAAPFEASLEAVGYFGEGDRIAAIWAGVAENAPLNALAAACERAARQAGLKPDTRRYTPHVTLAYLRRPDPASVARWVQSHNLLRSPPFRIERFGLYSSWRGREGSQYRLEQEYSLSTRGAAVFK